MHVFIQTNDAVANDVIVFAAGDDGSPAERGRYSTGGAGSGIPHLKSQGSVVVARDRLLVTNAGSGDVSVFAIDGDALNVTGFRIGERGLEPLDTTRALPGADPAQTGFTPDGSALLVTDRANDAILELPVR